MNLSGIDRYWLCKTLEMDTSGIGGDSLVKITEPGKIKVGPERVQPLATALGIPIPEKWIDKEINYKCFLPQINLSREEIECNAVLQYLDQHGPASPSALIETLKLSEFSLERKTNELVFRRQLVETGFTPTDALHVLKILEIGNFEKADNGARTLAALRNQEVNEFCEDVLSATREKIKEAILEAVFKRQTGKSLVNFTSLNSPNPLLMADFTLTIPIIGVGAAARFLLPKIAEELSTQVYFPDHYDVGNALGAIKIASSQG